MTNHPCQIIKIDKQTNKIALPDILLETRSGKIIGKISKYENFNVSLVGIGIDEVSFDVHKYVNGKKCPVWDDLIDLKLIELKGYGRFQIQVNYTDNTETVKAIHGQSLEVELGQLYLNEFHVNDDEAMDMVYTDYSKGNYDDEGNFIPTVFCNFDDKNHSLLHRVLKDKAPHWSIGNVPTYVSMSEDAEAELSSKFQRTYTENGTSIYDFLTGTVAQETNVVFIFDTFKRKIHCYNLFDCYINGEIVDGIGEDTLVFASKKNFLNEVSIESNQDQVKNCFRVEGGDDTITAMIAVANMNGTNYIWKFSDFQFSDMSDELQKAIKDYQKEMSSQSTKDEYYGENGIYTKLCEAYEQLYLKESTMMPSLTTVEVGTAEEQYNNIINGLNTSTVYVSNINNYSSSAFTGVTNQVESFATILMDSRFEIEVVEGSTSFSYNKETDTYGIWKGKIKITQRTDETNTYPVIIENSAYVSVKIGNGKTEDGEIEYMRQKVQKALAKQDMANLDFSFTDSDKEIRSYFEQFSLNRLKSFYDAYNECISILAELVSTNKSDIAKDLYDEYYRVLTIIDGVKNTRQKEVSTIDSEISTLESKQRKFQEDHDFQKHLEKYGENLYKEFCMYRREDTYSNPNYTSDSLETTTELLNKAKELMEVADSELSKACMLQRTVSTSLSNLLILPEFEPLYDSFALFNYIRVKTDDEILKLRLIGVDFSGDSIENINVTFSEKVETIDGKVSDTESILQQAATIATSYSSTVKQAKQGESANKEFIDIYSNGLDATKAMLSNNDKNEVTMTGAGLIAKRMDDEGCYGEKQLRITGNGMYLTDDTWKSLKMAVGEIIYTNPITGDEEEAYGIIADTLIGNLIAGKQMHIGNENGSVEITGDGITIYDNSTNKNKMFYADNDGNLHLTGTINANNGIIGGLYISENSIGYYTNIDFTKFLIDEEGKCYYDYDYYYSYETWYGTFDDGHAILRIYYNEQINAFYCTVLSVKVGNLNMIDNKYSGYNSIVSESISYVRYFNLEYDNFIYSEVTDSIYYYIKEYVVSGTEYNGIYCYEFNSSPNADGDEFCLYQERVSGTGYRTQVDIKELLQPILSELTYADYNKTGSIFINGMNTSFGSALTYSTIYDALEIKNINADIIPKQDAIVSLGNDSFRWKDIYASTSVISTSDKNKKQNISYGLDEYIALFDKLKPCSFEFIDGTSGRTHIGYIAQDVEDALNELGISSTKFGGFCKSSINGVEIYSLRYDEFQGLYDAKIKQLEKRLEKLENYILKNNEESTDNE